MKKILIVLIIFTLTIIIIGTLIVFFQKQYKATPTLPQQIPQNEEAVFSRLGIIRTKTKDNPLIPLVVKPSFFYDTKNTPFIEELNSKLSLMQKIIKTYFEQYTRKELLKKGENNIKSELIVLLNKELILGKIKILYFEEYIFFE